MTEKREYLSEQLQDSLLGELRRLAELQLHKERPNHTLHPTALVNEAWLVLQKQENLSLENRSQYLAAAACTIRRILIDYARRKNRRKRGGGANNLSLHSNALGIHEQLASTEVDVLDLEEALAELLAQNARAAKVVELRFYGGMSNEEIANELNVSVRTIVGDWTFARAWLSRALSPN